MGSERVPASSSAEVPLETMLADGVRDRADVAAFASRNDHGVSIMIWHYHDDDVAGPNANIELTVGGLKKQLRTATLTHYRIDERHSNVYAEWKRLGSPLAPDQNVYARLEDASKLALLKPAEQVRVERGTAKIDFDLPRQGVSLIELTW
jgi:xylan 1,4-beta-xylosidase